MAKSVGKATEDRAKLIAGFDALPDSALLDVPTSAAVVGYGESKFWGDAKSKPGHPKIIKVSTRCSRVNVGELRAYMRRLGALPAVDSQVTA